jgi:hypothetical protein
MLAGAGASITSMASSEIYNAMQTGVLDAANTSSSSFVSYRIYEQVACYTPAADTALWFMYQPLLMNKSTFDGLTEEQQEALLAAAAEAEAFYLEQAKAEDAASVEAFRRRCRNRRDDRRGFRGLARAGAGNLLRRLRGGLPRRAGVAGPGARGRVILPVRAARRGAPDTRNHQKKRKRGVGHGWLMFRAPPPARAITRFSKAWRFFRSCRAGPLRR